MQAEDDWPSLLARLETMRAALLTRDGAVVNLSADAPSMAVAEPLAAALLGTLPEMVRWPSPLAGLP